MRCISLSLFSACLLFAISARGQETFRHQTIALAPGDSTTFFFTNKTTGFYCGGARRLSSSSHQGVNLSGQEYDELVTGYQKQI
jgi:hypothetical protein